MTDTDRLDWLTANPGYVRALMWKTLSNRSVRQAIDELVAEQKADREKVQSGGVEQKP